MKRVQNHGLLSSHVKIWATPWTSKSSGMHSVCDMVGMYQTCPTFVDLARNNTIDHTLSSKKENTLPWDIITWEIWALICKRRHTGISCLSRDFSLSMILKYGVPVLLLNVQPLTFHKRGCGALMKDHFLMFGSAIQMLLKTFSGPQYSIPQPWMDGPNPIPYSNSPVNGSKWENIIQGNHSWKRHCFWGNEPLSHKVPHMLGWIDCKKEKRKLQSCY